MTTKIRSSRIDRDRESRIGGAFLAILLLALALIASNSARADELVQNGGFESGDFTGWNVSGDVNGAAISDIAHSGNWAATFQTDIFGSVTLSQTLPTAGSATAPAVNDLVFWLKWVDFPPDYALVRWNGTPIFYLGNRQSFPYQRVEIPDLQSFGPAELSFEFSSNQDSTWFLDDISVTGPGVPEPGTLMLLGSGVVGLAGMLRRRLS